MGGLSLGLSLSLSGSGGGAAPAFLVTNSANTTVTDLGGSEYQITKTGGVEATYDASANSSTALTGDFIIRFTPQTDGLGFFVGVNSDPLTDDTYTSIDYALFFTDVPNVQYWESGVAVGTAKATYTIGDNLYLKRSGSTLSYGHGGTDGVTGYTESGTATTSATLYFDSAFRNSSASVKVKRLA